RNPNQLVVDRVFPRTPAFYAGLRPGDVITTMNGNPITSVSAFTQAVQSGTANNIPLQVMRNGQMREISMATTLPGTTNDASVRTAMRPGFSTTNPLNTLQSGAGLINPTNQS